MDRRATMSKHTWTTVIIVALLTAVLASLITAGITGNVIRRNNNQYGLYQVYTKGEVDAQRAVIMQEMNTTSSKLQLVELESCTRDIIFTQENVTRELRIAQLRKLASISIKNQTSVI